MGYEILSSTSVWSDDGAAFLNAAPHAYAAADNWLVPSSTTGAVTATTGTTANWFSVDISGADYMDLEYTSYLTAVGTSGTLWGIATPLVRLVAVGKLTGPSISSYLATPYAVALAPQTTTVSTYHQVGDMLYAVPNDATLPSVPATFTSAITANTMGGFKAGNQTPAGLMAHWIVRVGRRESTSASGTVLNAPLREVRVSGLSKVWFAVDFVCGTFTNTGEATKMVAELKCVLGRES